MNILLLGNVHFKDSLEKLGHRVTAKAGDHAEMYDLTHFDGDLIILHETLGMRELPHGVERTDVPTVFYSVDVHLNLYWHKEYAKLFDYVFVSQKDYVDMFEHEQVYWLPWSINPDIFRDYGQERSRDIVFVGTIDAQRIKRKSIIDALKKRFRVNVYGTDPHQRIARKKMARLFSQAKIILNESIYGEINFRTFEALACGGMLLTENVANGLGELFIDGEEIVTFDHCNLIEKAEYYLHNHKRRREIAQQGMHKLFTFHTVQRRAQEMLGVLYDKKFKKRQRDTEEFIHFGKALYFTAMKFPRYRNRRLSRAAFFFKKSQTCRPSDYESALYLSLIQAYRKEYTKAKNTLRPWVNKQSDSMLQVIFGFLELESGCPSEAESSFKKAGLETGYADLNFMIQVGKLYEQHGYLHDIGLLHDGTIPLYAMQCYLHTPTLKGILCAANLHYKLGMLEAASMLYESVSKHIPGRKALHIKLARTYVYTYRFGLAIDVLQKIVPLNEVEHLDFLAQDQKRILKSAIRMNMQDYKGAINEIISIKSDEAYMRIGHAYMHLNDIPNALFYYQKACNKRSFDPEVHVLLGRAYHRLVNMPYAAERLQHSLSLKEDSFIRKLYTIGHNAA